MRARANLARQHRKDGHSERNGGRIEREVTRVADVAVVWERNRLERAAVGVEGKMPRAGAVRDLFFFRCRVAPLSCRL